MSSLFFIISIYIIINKKIHVISNDIKFLVIYSVHNVLIDITCSFHFKYKFRLCEILNNIISIFYLYCKLIIIL
ncbi:hypothetical protein PFBG_02762 [Plasmodium falciparum 7G8]|uniref:Uncharacterized protein n=1 Tax=Plasmodium falciparum (isolate 7G8) TaxID=57266 RepID=W7FCR8_PLAF8|nr:hypothetical protein PFBG_02762 [Plasmodium falciparum 7G8]